MKSHVHSQKLSPITAIMSSVVIESKWINVLSDVKLNVFKLRTFQKKPANKGNAGVKNAENCNYEDDQDINVIKNLKKKIQTKVKLKYYTAV